MKMFSRIRFLLMFALVALPLMSRAEGAYTYAEEAAKLNTELKRVGDFVLLDGSGKVYDVGHVLLDFGSVYLVLAKDPMAVGVCEFIHARLMPDGSLDRPGVYHMRYFFRDKDSVIRLNTDSPQEEVEVHFDMDLTKEFVQGVIKEAGRVEGGFRMRIRDAAPTKG